MRLILLLSLLLLLAACGGEAIQRKDGSSSARPFSLANLAKTDVDMVVEIHQREMLKNLELLTLKLYRRNPQEFRRIGLTSAEQATARIFDELPRWRESALFRLDWEATFRDSFREDYTGDRVQAFMSAMVVMVMAAYEHKTQFFLTDELFPQKLYNSARNIEVAIWKLSTARKADGTLFLLSHGQENGVWNLSFEREFGKLIARQDMLALTVEDKSNRTITRALQSAASFVFLPI